MLGGGHQQVTPIRTSIFDGHSKPKCRGPPLAKAKSKVRAEVHILLVNGSNPIRPVGAQNQPHITASASAKCRTPLQRQRCAFGETW